MKILASAYDYRPRLGGVASCSYELFRALARSPGVELRVIARLMPGDEVFDRHDEFETRRVRLPAEAALSIVPLATAIARESLAYKPDALLHMLWMPSAVASYAVRALVRRPNFIYAHGVELLESRRNLRKRARQLLMSPIKARVLRDAEAVFAVSRYTANRVSECSSLAPGRIRVVRNGVDPVAFAPATSSDRARIDAMLERLGLGGKRIFLTVARLEAYKGVDRCLSAFQRVVARVPDAAYVVCGTGPDRARLEALARSYQISDRVVFAGAVDGPALVDWYRAAHCLALVSREELETPQVEGFGLVFLEAAACGVPSIGGRSGGISDAVVDGETGWLVDPQSDVAVADAMLESLLRPEETTRRGEAARSRVLSELTWDHVASRVLEEMRRRV